MCLVKFSGYTWQVRSSGLSNPGPNYFSDSPTSVYVDKKGLHIIPVFEGGVWKCAEVSISTPLGYGKYEVEVECDFETLNPHLVAALFLYESDTCELDIEYSHTMVGKHKGQFVVQPGGISGNTHIFKQVVKSKHHAGATSNQHRWSIDWQKDKVIFSARYKAMKHVWVYAYSQNIVRKIKTWFYLHIVAPVVRLWKSKGALKQGMSVYDVSSTRQLNPDFAKLIINLWLYKGIEHITAHSNIDKDSMRKGICIRSFKFTK